MAETVKIHAPNADFNGKVGPVRFKAGVADVDKDHRLIAYFERKGYGVGKKAEPSPTVKARNARLAERYVKTKNKPTAKDHEPLDSTEYPDPRTARRNFGTPLRDAAVDPDPGDFLPPINAGKAHPHSPMVVSPGIHAEPPKPIRPGEVYVDDPDRQQKLEADLANETLVEGNDVTEATLSSPTAEPKPRRTRRTPAKKG